MGEFVPIGATPYLCPVPAVLLGCRDGDDKPNLITVAWTGIVCTKPPMISVSLKRERYSYGIITKTGEFTLNLVGAPLCEKLDLCGVKSGRDVDKFALCGLTAVPAPPLERAPAVGECPAYLCCRVNRVIPLGSHDLILANVLEVYVAKEYFTPSGAIDEGKMALIGYVHGKYRQVGDALGFFGYSVAGGQAAKRRYTKDKRDGMR